jgi:hypothetical protein
MAAEFEHPGQGHTDRRVVVDQQEASHGADYRTRPPCATA